MSQNAVIEALEKEQLKSDIPAFKVGDTISVHQRIIEGDKERIQIFTGIVVSRKGSGPSETVTLYKVSYNSGVERIFLIHSPKVAKIEVVRFGKVRKSKLYYLRGAFGKKAKVKERIMKKVGKAALPKEPAPEPAPEPKAEAAEEAPKETPEKEGDKE